MIEKLFIETWRVKTFSWPRRESYK